MSKAEPCAASRKHTSVLCGLAVSKLSKHVGNDSIFLENGKIWHYNINNLQMYLYTNCWWNMHQWLWLSVTDSGEVSLPLSFHKVWISFCLVLHVLSERAIKILSTAWELWTTCGINYCPHLCKGQSPAGEKATEGIKWPCEQYSDSIVDVGVSAW